MDGYTSTGDGADPSWYLDSGATDHMTNDMERLDLQDAYKGNDQIQVVNGMHIPISDIGDSFIPGSSNSLHLKNVPHTPKISKNLVSAHKLTNDNQCFVEVHPTSFFVKDLTTRTTLLHGKARDGLYPIPTPSRTHHANLAATHSKERTLAQSPRSPSFTNRPSHSSIK
jgi:hypothetical protein